VIDVDIQTTTSQSLHNHSKAKNIPSNHTFKNGFNGSLWPLIDVGKANGSGVQHAGCLPSNGAQCVKKEFQLPVDLLYLFLQVVVLSIAT
jgi:hypothetical protein